MNPVKVAIIGLDTSHSVALPKLMQDPEVEDQVRELRAVSCLRFSTPFQSEKGLDERQAYLESIGVKVTTDFDEAAAGCDAVMLEINDPSYHLEYFEKCAALGKPVFLDKPFADTLENTIKILNIAKEKNVRFFTASSLRFDIDIVEGLQRQAAKPQSATVWGPVGRAAAGSSIVWYGVHAFEILNRTMGSGAVTVSGSADLNGYVFHVIYGDGRRGIVELSRNCWSYGAACRDAEGKSGLIQVTGRIPFYKMLLKEIVKFFTTGEQPVELTDSIEVMAMLSAADESVRTGRPAPVYTLR
ncbi:MAG: Gfo/Idh/MocA family oxidoreductase [Lentisphaeria bacterium]|nr:Gfo/Idh/MocA family oxidoreductase [Lentisphaeria bacterium]